MKISRLCLLSLILLVMVSVSINAYADLYNRGTDSLGNRLIYDSDLDLTWYDYTNGVDSWQNQLNWASSLDIYFDGIHYTDWRLPSTVDGPYVLGYDGTTTVGYNITNSEMGHLFYMELENVAAFDTSGNLTGCGEGGPSCLSNTGDFQNLSAAGHWSGTDYSAPDLTNAAWVFGFYNGAQVTRNKSFAYSALAVRAGDVAVVPEPISSILFFAGGSLLAGQCYIKRKNRA